ncbi:MAG TPA: glycerol-3-phosphate dehydrogenase [Verrucomicrobiota bacterium]|nr:glycerol-3-phosphate dehydrogenase [Verrucomicrobiota bacterium]HQL78398.1 glycerol-3-phosphate dehydrogenase [Verrucomicrobiota bacterium]
MSSVAIVGAGLMGTAVAWPLSDNGHHVRLVGTHLDNEIIGSCLEKGWHPRLRRRLPDNVRPYCVGQLAEALEGVNVIVSGVSSPGVRWIGRALAPHLKPGVKIIAVTKGLEASAAGDLRVLPDVLADELPATVRDKVTLAAIGGPCIAGELAGRRQTCVYFTSRDAAALPVLRQMFRTPYYHISLSTDIIGVEVCVALKNAYTLAVGLAGGMLERLGGPDEAEAQNYNPAAALFGASAREMARLVSLLGGSPDKVTSLPGVGDQYVTCMGGRTVRLGRLLGKGLAYEQARAEMAGETLESAFVVAQIAKALPGLEARGLLGRDELPLMRCLCRVISGDTLAEVDFDKLFPDDVK